MYKRDPISHPCPLCANRDEPDSDCTVCSEARRLHPDDFSDDISDGEVPTTTQEANSPQNIHYECSPTQIVGAPKRRRLADPERTPLETLRVADPLGSIPERAAAEQAAVTPEPDSEGTHKCLICGVCLGNNYTRQFCGKTMCYGV